MSRRRRDRDSSSDDLINQLSENEAGEPAVGASLTALANAAYGSRVGTELFPELNKGRIKVSLLPLDQIYPDYSQPRRVIPSGVRQYWNGNSDETSIAQLFEMWLKEIALERKGKTFDLDGYIQGTVTERAPQSLDEIDDKTRNLDIGAFEQSFLRIVTLAGSIKRDGLTNPITVVARNNQFVIETGERRWLAFQLLNWYYRGTDDTWSKIPARVMDQMSIWRQATENNARADLNAIAKARQLALVIMELYSQMGVKFRPFEVFNNEQAFYAQVADPIQYKIPYGKGELVLSAMGFENKSTVKRYRDLLSLPPEVWIRADDYNVPESVLRQMVNKPVEQQMGLFNMWLDNGRLTLNDTQGMVFDRKRPTHFGKFGRLMEYDFDQLQGEFDDLDSNSKQLVLNFLKTLVKRLSS